MTEFTPPKLKKWPFLLADLLLLIVAVYAVSSSRALPPGWWAMLLLASVAIAAWFGVTPFVIQYRAEVKFAEANGLATAVDQITNLRTFTNQISFATAQWQLVQEQATKTVGMAKDITDRMALEAEAFSKFMQKASDSEKGHLRLEVDKLRRTETEWLQVLVLTLDHVYALFLAGRRSGQQSIIQQLGSFQNACRDVARKVGLVPFEAQGGEQFNPKMHQLLEQDGKPKTSERIAETLAPGYTFQGQLIRNALVSLEAEKPGQGEPEPDLLLSGS
jgi:molecular chaperone GrpE (heat shock protein)